MKLQILYEDRWLIACIKPAGISAQSPGMPELVAEHLSADGGKMPYVGVVHRLDMDVSGVMIFAKDAQTAAALSAQITEKTMRKEYLAVVRGVMEQAGEMRDLLYHDRTRNKTYIATRPRRGVL